MPNAALYLRISQDRTDDQAGVDRQRTECLARLDRVPGEWTVTEFMDNNVSATSTKKRPAYSQMVAEVERGVFDAVLCWDLDRLTRKPREIEDWVDVAEHHGIRLMTVQDDIDLASDNGRLFARIKAAVARSEVERKAARQKASNAQRAAAGIPFSGKFPYGYSNDRITPLEPEAQIIRDMYASVIAGDSIHGIANRLNAAGILTSNRTKLNDQGVQVPLGKKWTSTQVKAILRRERNVGRLVVNGQVSEGPSTIMPLVSVEDFDLVQSILNSRITAPGPKVQINWLTSLMTCSVCGAPMFGKKVSGQGRYYQCSAALKKTGEPGVRHVAVSAPVAEKQVLGRLFVLGMAGAFNVRLAEGVGVRAAQEALAELRLDRDQATDALFIRGADTIRIGKRLSEIDQGIRNAEAVLVMAGAREAVARPTAIIYEDGVTTVETMSDDEWSKLDFGRLWTVMNLDERRAWIKLNVAITVTGPGKGASRVLVSAL